REAVAGDRQEGAERAPGVAADRLAHRHPLGDQGPRDGGPGAAVARGGGEGGAPPSTPLVEALFAAGWRSAAEVASAKPDELAAVPGVGGVDAAKTMIAAAV